MSHQFTAQQTTVNNRHLLSGLELANYNMTKGTQPNIIKPFKLELTTSFDKVIGLLGFQTSIKSFTSSNHTYLGIIMG